MAFEWQSQDLGGIGLVGTRSGVAELDGGGCGTKGALAAASV